MERTNRFASTTPAAATARFDPIFLEVGIIGMARTWVQVCLRVVLWALILVFDEQANGSA